MGMNLRPAPPVNHANLYSPFRETGVDGQLRNPLAWAPAGGATEQLEHTCSRTLRQRPLPKTNRALSHFSVTAGASSSTTWIMKGCSLLASWHLKEKVAGLPMFPGT